MGTLSVCEVAKSGRKTPVTLMKITIGYIRYAETIGVSSAGMRDSD